MYKYQSKQITIMDFGMPCGMELRADNEWVQRARLVPWDFVEDKYSRQYENSKTGNVAKHSRLVFGSLAIQRFYNCSDRVLVRMIRDTPCLQYFCGLPEFKQEAPFNASSLVNFRKRMTPEFMDKINEKMISIGLNVMTQVVEHQEKQEAEGEKILKKVTMNDEVVIDSSACPQYITYPTDIKLIYAVVCKLLIMLIYLLEIDLDFKVAKKQVRDIYLNVVMKKKRTQEDIRCGVGKLLEYVDVYLKRVVYHLSIGKTLPNRFIDKLPIIIKIYEQQIHKHRFPDVTIPNRILSLSAWWSSSIYRNKDGAKFEYGSQFDLSTNNDFVRIERLSFAAYNEEINLPTAIERYLKNYGHYPSAVLADTKYRNENNRNLCSEHNIKLPGKPLGKNKAKEVNVSEAEEIEHKNKRTIVERKFSYVKGSFGLDCIHTFHPDTTKAVIYLGVFAMNLETTLKYAMRLPEFLLLFIIRSIYTIISLLFAPYSRFKPSVAQ